MVTVSNNLILISIISIGLWIINFYHYEGYPYIFRCAKGFGLNLRVWTMFMYYTMCKSIMRGNIEKHISYHKTIGLVLTLCTLGHTSCHLTNTGFISTPIYITGYFLTLSMILILFGYLIKERNYSIFKFIHYLYYPWLIVCILHKPDLKFWFITPLIVFFVEHFMNYFSLQYSSIKNEIIFDDENGFSKPIIYLPISRKLNSIPGSYYYICVPKCGLEWHPYSVANSHSVNQLLFLIEVKGDWTNRLYKLLKTKTSEEDITVIVMGPYITPSCDILKTQVKNKLCICSGSGISPFLSVIDSKIDDDVINEEFRKNHKSSFLTDFEQNMVTSTEDIEMKTFRKKERPVPEAKYSNQKLKVIWVFRKVNTMHNFLIYIKGIMVNSKNVDLDVYITGPISDEEEKVRIKSEYYLPNIKIFFCRPNFEKELQLSENDFYDSVNYCGNKQMGAVVKSECKKRKIEFKCEIFA